MNGFDGERLQRAWALVEGAVARGEIPGAVVLAGRRGHPDVGPLAWGDAALAPERRPMAPDTIFDLASLTKVVCTAMACWAALERGLLRLQDPVGRFLPGAAAADRTVRDLLTHTSGLPAGRDLRAAGPDPQARLAAALATPPVHPAGLRVEYSDLGFIVLGALLAAAAGRPFADLAAETVFAPLGMAETRFLPPADWRPRIAPTEWSAELGEHAWGVVHDENARALGGVAGHAGLFSTAADLGRLCRALLGGGPPVLSPAATAAMTRNVTAHLNADRTPGWEAAGRGGAAGDLLGPDAFGHTGFTGTSLWIAPGLGLYCVLLSNRVHLGRERTGPPVSRLRALLHNALAAALEPAGARAAPPRRRPRVTARLVLLRERPRGPEVLLAYHRHPEREFWCFPGGGVEPGETLPAAAVREAEEETGLRVSLDGVCHVQDRPEADTVDVFYWARAAGGAASLGGDPERVGAPPVLTDLRWVPLAELPRHRVLPADLAAQLAAGRHPGSGSPA